MCKCEAEDRDEVFIDALGSASRLERLGTANLLSLGRAGLVCSCLSSKQADTKVKGSIGNGVSIIAGIKYEERSRNF